jgi:hypothetical protein
MKWVVKMENNACCNCTVFIKLINEWWEKHQYDTTGRYGDYNVYDEEPEFVKLAIQLKRNTLRNNYLIKRINCNDSTNELLKKLAVSRVKSAERSLNNLIKWIDLTEGGASYECNGDCKQGRECTCKKVPVSQQADKVST